ncbi:hypothetical protein AB0K16_08880 [Nonomuraea jabiensis]|uniref:hypothetical protein n=1 Tax=Nonomuraea jabiensis TaxID=882448 RepID=UPI003427004B
MPRWRHGGGWVGWRLRFLHDWGWGEATVAVPVAGAELWPGHWGVRVAVER